MDISQVGAQLAITVMCQWVTSLKNLNLESGLHLNLNSFGGFSLKLGSNEVSTSNCSKIRRT
jgi:hypothetical protein